MFCKNSGMSLVTAWHRCLLPPIHPNPVTAANEVSPKALPPKPVVLHGQVHADRQPMPGKLTGTIDIRAQLWNRHDQPRNTSSSDDIPKSWMQTPKSCIGLYEEM